MRHVPLFCISLHTFFSLSACASDIRMRVGYIYLKEHCMGLNTLTLKSIFSYDIISPQKLAEISNCAPSCVLAVAPVRILFDIGCNPVSMLTL